MFSVGHLLCSPRSFVSRFSLYRERKTRFFFFGWILIFSTSVACLLLTFVAFRIYLCAALITQCSLPRNISGARRQFAGNSSQITRPSLIRVLPLFSSVAVEYSASLGTRIGGEKKEQVASYRPRSPWDLLQSLRFPSLPFGKSVGSFLLGGSQMAAQLSGLHGQRLGVIGRFGYSASTSITHAGLGFLPV